MSRPRRSDADTGDGHFFKLIEIPFSPFQNEFGDDDDDEFDNPAARRSYNGNYGSRQEYLRSYTFSRKQTMQERVKSRLGRLKAAAWAVVACNCNLIPRRIRRMKEKLALKSLRHGSCPRSRSPSVRSPFLQGACFRA